jgi:hypothetical protein
MAIEREKTDGEFAASHSRKNFQRKCPLCHPISAIEIGAQASAPDHERGWLVIYLHGGIPPPPHHAFSVATIVSQGTPTRLLDT